MNQHEAFAAAKRSPGRPQLSEPEPVPYRGTMRIHGCIRLGGRTYCDFADYSHLLDGETDPLEIARCREVVWRKLIRRSESDHEPT